MSRLLPRARAVARGSCAEVKVASENGEGGLQGLKVLVIDDSKTIRRTAETLLAKEGCEVFTAIDGFDAVEQAKQCQPELVVLDFAMPVLNGLGAAARISQLLPDVPIVMYTLYESPQLHLEARKCGITQVVSKSDAELLIASLEAITQTSPTRKQGSTPIAAGME